MLTPVLPDFLNSANFIFQMRHNFYTLVKTKKNEVTLFFFVSYGETKNGNFAFLDWKSFS